MSHYERTDYLLLETKTEPLINARNDFGSSIHGGPHWKGSQPTGNELRHTDRMFEAMRRDMKRMHDAGKGITLRSEGIAGGHEGTSDRHLHDRTVAYAKSIGMDLKVDTMEHEDADTDNPESKIVQHFHKTHGEHETNASLFAMHHSQGRSHKDSAHHLTPESRVHLDKMYGAPEGPKGTYSDEQRKMMFSASFPRDAESAAHLERWKGNPEAEKHLKRQVSMIDHFNQERQGLALQHIKNDEAENRGTIISIGDGHFAGDHGSIGDKLTKDNKKGLEKGLGEDTTVPRKKWNPISKFQDVTRGIDKGHVTPKGGDMTTIDPRSGLPMSVVKLKARWENNKRKRKSNPGSNEGAGQEPEI